VLNRRSHNGFTLTEVLVAMAIIALMVLVSLPSMTAYFQSAKIGSAAQTYAAGLQAARAEAIRRNTQVRFVLTDTNISTPNIANVAVPSATGRSWVVSECDPVTATCNLVQAKSALEGSGQAAGSIPTVAVTGTATAGPAFDGTIVFDGLGRTTSPGEVRLVIDNQAGGACGPAGPMRCLNVRAAPGGQIRVCDSQAILGDSRACL
jgi:type IV fimbrial biogenesis protein FimT